MTEFNTGATPNHRTADAVAYDAGLRSYMLNIYNYMGSALALTGVVALLTYTGASVARVFFITAGTFGAMSLYGYTTQRDLTKLGSFLIMGVIGLILASLVNLFLQSSALHFVLSVVGVLIFTGLTAYDTQKLKSMYAMRPFVSWSETVC